MMMCVRLLLSFFMVLVSFAAYAQCPSDSTTLVAIYNATGGSSWTNGWTLTDNYSTWPGVTTAPNGCVTALSLPNNNLTGTLPADIGNLSELQELNLSNNGLTGNLPVALGNLSQLDNLNLSGNAFDGAFPALTIADGTLSNLDIRNNNLQDFAGFSFSVTAPGGAISDNAFTFADIVPHISQLNNNQLSPQDSLPINVAGLTLSIPSATEPNNEYQWFKDGVALPGETNPTYDMLINADYHCEITNPNAPGLTLYTQIHRETSIVCDIGNNTLSASGVSVCPDLTFFLIGENPSVPVPEFEFQWQKSLDSLNWVDIDTTRDFVGSFAATDTVVYLRRIINAACGASDTSEVSIFNVILTVNGNAISLTDSLVCVGFPMEIRGDMQSGIQTYLERWEVSTDTVNWQDASTQADFTDIQTFRIDAYPNQLRYYRRKLIGNCDTVISNFIKIDPRNETVQNSIAVDGDTLVCFNDSLIALTGSAEDPEIRFQWESILKNDTTGIWAALDTTQDLTVQAISDTTYFRRVALGLCDSDTSDTVALYYLPPISQNTLTQTEVTICKNESIDTVQALPPLGADGNFTYAWLSRADSDSVWIEVGSSELFGTGSLTDTTFFRRVVTSRCESDTSNILQVNVIPEFGPNQISASHDMCMGQVSDTLIGTVQQDSGRFAFRWQFLLDTVWTDASDSASRLVDYPPYAFTDTTQVRRIVYGGCFPDTSNTIQVNVIPRIENNFLYFSESINNDSSIFYNPETGICLGDPAPQAQGFAVTGGDGTYQYTWQKLGKTDTAWVTLPNTNALIRPDSVMDTTQYRRVVVSNCHSDTSNILTINVYFPISGSHIADSQAICRYTQPALLTGNVPEFGNLIYEYHWELSTDSMQTWTTLPDSLQNYQPADSMSQHTWFRRVAFSACFTDTSNVVFIEVSDLIENNEIDTTQFVCFGTQPDLLRGTQAQAGTPPFAYQWQFMEEGDSIWRDLQGETGLDFQPNFYYNPFDDPDSTMHYRRIVTDACQLADTSEVITVHVLPYPIVTTSASVQQITAGQSTQLEATGGVTYEWDNAQYLDDANIPNPVASPLETTKFTVTVTSADGCTATGDVIIYVGSESLIEAMNVMTPNGDGDNDFLYLLNIEIYRENKLTILNRWGQKLLTLDNYDNTWNGTVNNEPLPEGTYYFVLELPLINDKISGSFTILR